MSPPVESRTPFVFHSLVPTPLTRCTWLPPPDQPTIAPPEPPGTIQGAVLFAVAPSTQRDHAPAPFDLKPWMSTPEVSLIQATTAPPPPSEIRAGSFSLS